MSHGKPNILFLMTDQMQGRVLSPGHPCITPNLDKLAARGVRFSRAYCPNAVCSPSRASLMTGLLPHNHGVLSVTHTVDPDQSCLRTEHPHWAQHLEAAGYRTGYFGKWHVERSGDLARFGWQVDGADRSPLREARIEELTAGQAEARFSHDFELATPGYRSSRFYGVTSTPPELRGMGVSTSLGLDFLDTALKEEEPWCCFVSLSEPHDPFICGEAAFEQYDVDAIELQPNVGPPPHDAPRVYRKAARVWAHMSERQHREATACYYASITEIDEQFGRLIDRVEAAGQLDRTIVVVTSDHGEMLGTHGMYCKNFSGYEEVYNIPLIVAGPELEHGVDTRARVGLHDVGPTLLNLTGCEPIDVPDSRSFATVLNDAHAAEDMFQTGYAEYAGNRYCVTQRVAWDGPWKFCLNGFDFDELYNLDEDPFEMRNRIDDPAYADRVREMCRLVWQRVKDTGDHSLLNSHYPILRLAPYGPLVLDEPAGEQA